MPQFDPDEVAHYLKAPLNRLVARTYRLKNRLNHTEFRELETAILDAGDRIDAFLTYLQVSRPSFTLSRQSLAVDDLITTLKHLIRHPAYRVVIENIPSQSSMPGHEVYLVEGFRLLLKPLTLSYKHVTLTLKATPRRLHALIRTTHPLTPATRYTDSIQYRFDHKIAQRLFHTLHATFKSQVNNGCPTYTIVLPLTP